MMPSRTAKNHSPSSSRA